MLLSVGRYVIRYRSVHTLDVSDAFHGISLILLIALTIEYTIVFPDLFTLLTPPELGEGPTKDQFKEFLRFRIITSCI